MDLFMHFSSCLLERLIIEGLPVGQGCSSFLFNQTER